MSSRHVLGHSPCLASCLALCLALCPTGAQAGKSKEPPSKSITVDDAVREKSTICTDGKSHYVVIAPDEHHSVRLFYGDGTTFHDVPGHPSGMMTGDWFPEPRFFNKTYNDNFRGLDLRHFSHVEKSKDGTGCDVTCGEHTAKLTALDAAKAKDMLKGANFLQSPRKTVPHRLNRDDNGVYYYVDRGFAPGTEKSFRLFVGPKGNLKQQKMTNVVSDSEGEIFATKTGSLRLVLGNNESSWIEGEKVKRLTMVPVDANQMMIYNELGVYIGERLGNPCDDL